MALRSEYAYFQRTTKTALEDKASFLQACILGTAFPLLLALKSHIMWRGSTWKNSLPCCKLKGAAFSLLTPTPLPEKNKRGHTRIPDDSKTRGHWCLGPKQEAELSLFQQRLGLLGGPGAKQSHVTQSSDGGSWTEKCGGRLWTRELPEASVAGAPRRSDPPGSLRTVRLDLPLASSA